MQSQGGHSGEANPTCPSEGNRKYLSQIRPEGTNDKNIMRERCASHARRGVGRELTFPKFKDCLHGAPDACRLIIACEFRMREHLTKKLRDARWEAAKPPNHAALEIYPKNLINRL